MSRRASRLAAPLAAFAISLAALLTAAYLTLAPGTRAVGASTIGGPFSLVDGDGRKVTDQTYAGEPHLVFFGFTHCPDICPTKLFQMSEMFRAMGQKGKDLRALFITIDPDRDKPGDMKSYVSSFDPRIVGLTGDQSAIDQVARGYRAYAKKVPLKDGDYTMEHTALVYLMDKDGHFVGSFNLERAPEQAAKELLGYL